jgi:hypothetical protein
MTVSSIGNAFYTGLSSDTKPTTGVITGALFIENDTGVVFYYNGTVWTAGASGSGGGGSGEANTGANVGTGAGTVFRDKTTTVLNFKTIKAGSGVVITNNTDDITLDATGSGGGEVNTYSTSGTGLAWTQTKSGVNLPFRSLIAGSTKLSATQNTNDITIDVNQANLAIAYSQLTSVPATIVHTNQANIFGSFAQTFPSSQLKIQNPAGTFSYMIAGSAITSGISLVLPLLTGSDTVVTANFGQTLANKIIAAGSNTITGIVDANISNHTSTKITIIDKTHLPLTGVNTDQDNLFGAFTQTIPSGGLKILNPAGTFGYSIVGSAITTANRNITLPLLTGDETLAVLALAQTFSNKTVNTDANTIKHSTTNNSGDLLVNTGTKFDRLARGTSLQVYRINSAGTAGEFASLDSERTGKATASGNGSTTSFTIAHGLGATPGYAFVDCSSHAIARTWTVDGTNITVTFASAPSSGTNNVIIYWRVIAS